MAPNPSQIDPPEATGKALAGAIFGGTPLAADVDARARAAAAGGAQGDDQVAGAGAGAGGAEDNDQVAGDQLRAAHLWLDVVGHERWFRVLAAMHYLAGGGADQVGGDGWNVTVFADGTLIINIDDFRKPKGQ